MSLVLQEIAPRLFQCVSGLKGLHQPVSSYIWKSEHGTILIDPAGDVDSETVRQAGGGPVRHILITHLQRENVEGCFNFPDAQVHVPAGDEYLAEGAEAYDNIIEAWQPPWDWDSRGNFHGNMSGAKNERPPEKPLALAASLQPGSEFLGCRIIPTPGHGKNAITLLAFIGERSIAFCGDVICGDGKLWNWFDSEWDYGLQTGHLELLQSVKSLQRRTPDILCPAHGPVIYDAQAALEKLSERLWEILKPAETPPGPGQVNFTDTESPAPGFREVLPNLHQYREDMGNCNVLVAASGKALMIDDGLCFWKPLPERAEHHREVINQLKRSLGISKIEIVIPTHYHGDHTENIPELVEMEGTQVVCLDTLADVIEHPGKYDLACTLPWYGTRHGSFKVDRRMRDGEILRWEEFELEIFHLGGQTNYHLGVNVDIGGVRTLFVGDSATSLDASCEAVLCYNDSEPVHRGWLHAVERMLERKPDLLVGGHACCRSDPMPGLKVKRREWNKRMKQYREISYRRDLDSFFSPFL